MDNRNLIQIFTSGTDFIASSFPSGYFIPLLYCLPFYDPSYDPTILPVSAIPDISAVDDPHTTVWPNGEVLWNLSSINNLEYSLSSDKKLYFYPGQTGTSAISGNPYNNTTYINLISGSPLSTVVSGSSITYNYPNWEVSNYTLTSANPNQPTGWPDSRSLYFRTISYAPISSAAGGKSRGLYKVRLSTNVGNFKFNKIGIFAVRMLDATTEDLTHPPVLFACAYLPVPVIKSNNGSNISVYEADIELQMDAYNNFSQISFINSTNWNYVAGKQALWFDGDVAISTSAVLNQWNAQAKLHITNSDVLKPHMRLSTTIDTEDGYVSTYLSNSSSLNKLDEFVASDLIYRITTTSGSENRQILKMTASETDGTVSYGSEFSSIIIKEDLVEGGTLSYKIGPAYTYENINFDLPAGPIHIFGFDNNPLHESLPFSDKHVVNIFGGAYFKDVVGSNPIILINGTPSQIALSANTEIRANKLVSNTLDTSAVGVQVLNITGVGYASQFEVTKLFAQGSIFFTDESTGINNYGGSINFLVNGNDVFSVSDSGSSLLSSLFINGDLTAEGSIVATDLLSVGTTPTASSRLFVTGRSIFNNPGSISLSASGTAYFGTGVSGAFAIGRDDPLSDRHFYYNGRSDGLGGPYIEINVPIESELTINNNVNINTNLNVLGLFETNTSIAGTAISDTVETTTLNVAGASAFTGAATLQGDIKINQTLSGSGHVTWGGNVGTSALNSATPSVLTFFASRCTANSYVFVTLSTDLVTDSITPSVKVYPENGLFRVRLSSTSFSSGIIKWLIVNPS